MAWHIFGRARIPKDLDEHAVISAIHEKYPDLQDEDRENVVIICQHYVECASHTFFSLWYSCSTRCLRTTGTNCKCSWVNSALRGGDSALKQRRGAAEVRLPPVSTAVCFG